MINIAIVDDDFAFAYHLKNIMNNDKKLKCDHIFVTGNEALKNIPDIMPDVVLMDIYLPDITGIECISKLKPLTTAEYLICSNFENNELIFNALSVGATGYITKSQTIDEILKSIYDISNGGAPMNPEIARKVVLSFNNNNNNNLQECHNLTLREQEILHFLSNGLSYKEIAEKISISTETVRTHIRNIYIKLQVKNKVEAINKFYKK